MNQFESSIVISFVKVKLNNRFLDYRGRKIKITINNAKNETKNMFPYKAHCNSLKIVSDSYFFEEEAVKDIKIKIDKKLIHA